MSPASPSTSRSWLDGNFEPLWAQTRGENVPPLVDCPVDEANAQARMLAPRTPGTVVRTMAKAVRAAHDDRASLIVVHRHHHHMIADA